MLQLSEKDQFFGKLSIFRFLHRSLSLQEQYKAPIEIRGFDRLLEVDECSKWANYNFIIKATFRLECRSYKHSHLY